MAQPMQHQREFRPLSTEGAIERLERMGCAIPVEYGPPKGAWYDFGYSPHPESQRGCALWATGVAEAVALSTTLDFDFRGICPFYQKHYELRPSRLMQLPGGLTRPDVLHAICFLSFVAARAGVKMDLLLGDDGPIHTLVHARQFGFVSDDHHTDRTIDQILWLESVTPGLPPDNLDLPVIYDSRTDFSISATPITIDRIERMKFERRLYKGS